MHNLEFLIPITFFASVAFIAFKLFDDRHRERMMIIEKGLASEEVKALYTKNWTWRVNPMSSLKWGLLMAFIGAGILIGGSVKEMYPWMDGGRLVSGFIFLFGGIGLVVFYALAAKQAQKEGL